MITYKSRAGTTKKGREGDGRSASERVGRTICLKWSTALSGSGDRPEIDAQFSTKDRLCRRAFLAEKNIAKPQKELLLVRNGSECWDNLSELPDLPEIGSI